MLKKYLGFLLILLFGFSPLPVIAQGAAPLPVATPPPSAPAEPALPKPIPISEIALQAEKGLITVRQITNRSPTDEVLEAATEQLPLLERETGYRLQEARRSEKSGYSLEDIRGLEEELKGIQSRALPIRDDLTHAALQVEHDLAELDQLEAIWTATFSSATEAGAPPEVLERAKGLTRIIAAAKKNVLDDRERTLALQGRATDIVIRLVDMRQLLSVARQRAANRLLQRDGPPIWNPAFQNILRETSTDELVEGIGNQVSAIGDYTRSHISELAFHGLFFLGLFGVFASIRAKVRELCTRAEQWTASEKVFASPLPLAMMLSLLPSPWAFPHPPQAFWLLVSVLISLPLMAFANRVTEKNLRFPISVVVISYLSERLLGLLMPLPGVLRLLLLAEALGLALVAALFLRRQGSPIGDGALTHRWTWQIFRWGSQGAFLLSLIVVAFNVAGYWRLAELLLRDFLIAAYAAVALYVLAQAVGGMVPVVLCLSPISRLQGIRLSGQAFVDKINRWVTWIAFLFWIFLTLQSLGLSRRAMDWTSTLWHWSVKIGHLDLSIRDLSLFILILWATYWISRLSRLVLEKAVLSRLRLERGLPYAVLTTIRYVILLSGFVFALTAIGVDMTKVTIVAGALTVGIGFGLQNIVNNFVSGLIVLFERPVKVGDTIQLDDIIGRVQRIGIRATVIHSTAGAEVIIPNGKLISDRVTNWTLSSQLRQITVPVYTKPDIDVTGLTTLLMDIARQNPTVLESPSPEVLFIKRGIDAFEFELRIWIRELDAWQQVRSDLTMAINEALKSNDLPAQALSTGPQPHRDAP